MVIKPLEEDSTPGTVKPFQVSLVEPVAYQFQLQPEEQRQEKLSADSDVSGRDQGIHCRGVAQRRPSDGQTDRGPSANGICRCAEDGENAAGSRRFGLLLLGRGASV